MPGRSTHARMHWVRPYLKIAVSPVSRMSANSRRSGSPMTPRIALSSWTRLSRSTMRYAHRERGSASGTAALKVVMLDVRLERRLECRDLDQPQVEQRARLLDQTQKGGVVALVIGHHQRDAGRIGSLDHRAALGD